MQHPIIEEARPDLVKLLKREEGLRLKPYLCSAGVPTIGIGATTYPDGTPVRLSDPAITERMAMQMVAVEADRYMSAVLDVCKVWPTVNQLVAMASLAYNIGVGAFGKSTVLRLHNRGDHDGAARAFGLWNKAKVRGKLTVLNGLTARRARESALYLTPGEDQEPVSHMPQAVASESSLAASPIALSGGVTSATGVLGLASLTDNLQTASDAVDKTTGILSQVQGVTMINPLVVLAVVAVVAGGIAVFYRWKQRREGWA
jgi:lysozyme